MQGIDLTTVGVIDCRYCSCQRSANRLGAHRACWHRRTVLFWTQVCFILYNHLTGECICPDTLQIARKSLWRRLFHCSPDAMQKIEWTWSKLLFRNSGRQQKEGFPLLRKPSDMDRISSCNENRQMPVRHVCFIQKSPFSFKRMGLSSFHEKKNFYLHRWAHMAAIFPLVHIRYVCKSIK